MSPAHEPLKDPLHTFTAPGTYDYRCTLHGGMGGRVVVTEETA